MENTMKEMTIVPITGQVISETTMGLDVPYIDAEEVFDNENHPNFIESNTQAITLEELTSKNIIPTFGDNTLTISHQSFIGAVTKVAEQVFGELKPVECRVSHPIIGRIPSAQHKKANELREDHFLSTYGLCRSRKEFDKNNQRTNSTPCYWWSPWLQ